MKAVFIANLLAVRHHAAGWRKLTSYVRENRHLACDIWLTEFAGQANQLARKAIHAGYDTVVAVGGDGTVNEVLNGFLEKGSRANQNAVLAIIPLGTGCDLARSLGISRDTAEAIKVLESDGTKRIDVGKVDFLNHRRERESRFFANMAEAGAGGVVIREANRAPRILGQRKKYLWGILSATLSYKPRTVSISIDGGKPLRLEVRNLIVANGRYFGQGLLPAPLARLDDGLFDIVSIGNFGILEGLWHLPKLRRGTHLSLEKVSYFQGQKVEINTGEEVLLELDGELVGTLPATAEILPRAIGVKTG